jgi:TolB-like protein
VVERELGRGGMGTVYLATDRKHGRKVAIKVLPPDVAAALGPDRFLREIGIVARLSHPHILPLHDSGQASGLLYYVMPYVQGESLRQRLHRSPPLIVSEALAIAGEIADALAHAHANGVIHRDVKPDNILMHEGHALLADFGVAREAKDGQITDSGLPVGTASYTSPEQAAGSRQVDQRTDVYGLGCVLYEMLAGPSPKGHELLERRFAEPLPKLSATRDTVPSWLDAVLARALAARPEERFPTVAEFRAALVPPVDLGGLASPSARARGRSDRVRWMVAGALAFSVIGAAAAFLPGRLSHPDTKQVVVAGFENKTGDSTLAPVGEIAIDYIARGLAATGLLHDVYDARATALEAGQPVRIGVAAGRELAKRVGAGTVLGGSYYRDGDSLHFEAQLVDAATGKLVLSLQPVVGSLDDKTRVIEGLRQRVMAAFAVVFQSAFGEWQAASVPPDYDAYQQLLAANDDLWVFDNERAHERLHRAISRDSAYTTAKALLAYTLAEMGRCRDVDSVARSLAQSPGPLPPADQGWVSYAEANCRHDVEGKLTAAKAVLAAAPHSVGFTVLAGINAIELGRPREGLAILRHFDADHAPLSLQQRHIYWNFVQYAYHDLNQFDKELQVSNKVIDEPSSSALAGRGDSAAVRRLVEGSLRQPDRHIFEFAECAALELRAHGSAPTASALFDRIATAHGPEGVTDSGEGPCLWNLFSAAYYAERWGEVRAGYAQRVSEDSGDVKAHAALAALAVRRGDSTDLEREKQWLSAHGEDALARLGLARVAALQGHRDEAVALLRKALDRAVERHFLHIDPDFESLRDYPPYQELMRPKG